MFLSNKNVIFLCEKGGKVLLKDNLKRIREQRKFSKLELARRSGVTGRTIEGLESGANQNPQINTLKKLATALATTINELID